jgi:hypothetical protein
VEAFDHHDAFDGEPFKQVAGCLHQRKIYDRTQTGNFAEDNGPDTPARSRNGKEHFLLESADQRQPRQSGATPKTSGHYSLSVPARVDKRLKIFENRLDIVDQKMQDAQEQLVYRLHREMPKVEDDFMKRLNKDPPFVLDQYEEKKK